ncbi:MAG TPA: type 4a pilus biogenesis protein PilO [Clostridia bacterium]|nr:type 4a pilus biogenesis protein PilO [Clostridia bacterium]
MFAGIGDSRKRLIIFSVIVALLMAGVYSAYLQARLYHSVREEVNATIAEINHTSNIIYNFEEENSELQRVSGQLKDIESTTLAKIQSGEIPMHIAGEAENMGLSVVVVEPSKIIREQYYRVLPVSMTVRGAYDRVLEFLSGLEEGETAGGLTEIQTLSLEKDCDTGETNADFTLYIYLRS